jgi:hypothetical protein
MANKKCMVFETLGPTTGMELQESQNTNEVRLTGVFGVCGVKNENRRIYSKENYGVMVDALQKTIVSEGLMGELEHPNTMNINLNNVSHKIESIEMNEDGTITGTILLLDTAKGKDAQAIVKGGLPLYISSRGAGSIDESGHVTLSTIKTYDLVGTPGFAQARLNLKANQTLECLNEGLDDENAVWAIVEDSDEDLLGDGKEKKEEDNKDNEGDNKDNGGDGENKDTDGDNGEKKDETSEEDDNNKNSDKDTTMTELKQAIDQLTEKVTSLEAELHVAQESLNAKDEEIKTLNEKLASVDELTKRVDEFKSTDYDSIENWVKNEFAPEFKNEISESVNSEIQSWIVDDFSTTIQNWVCEEFAPEVQNWVCEEFAPEVQNWVCEEFAPEVQNWVCEEFAPEVQNWICEEFAPDVQNWVCEEFAPVIEGWITEEFAPENNEQVQAKVNENVNAFFENQKTAKIDEIDALLESLSKSDDEGAALKILKEQKSQDKFAGVYAVENMPAEYQPSWNALNEERQDEIVRMSKAYDFTKEGVLESFWQGIDFTTKPEVKVNETKDVVENHYNNVYAQMMRLRRA